MIKCDYVNYGLWNVNEKSMKNTDDKTDPHKCF